MNYLKMYVLITYYSMSVNTRKAIFLSSLIPNDIHANLETFLLMVAQYQPSPTYLNHFELFNSLTMNCDFFSEHD